jgi:hypothetical protein
MSHGCKSGRSTRDIHEVEVLRELRQLVIARRVPTLVNDASSACPSSASALFKPSSLERLVA